MPTFPVSEVKPIARVLVIDNREQVRRDLRRGLESRGYQVVVVEGDGERLHRNALAIACDFRPHIAIVDLRLDDDYDTSDTSGLKLLDKLRKRSAGLGVIVYSAYLTPTVDRKIKELAAEWVDKSDEPRVLKETVDRLAAQTCAVSRPFTVTWPKDWERSDTVFKVFEDKIPPSLLDDVIAQLFERGKRVWIRHIEDVETLSAAPVSRGRSLVVKVEQQGNLANKIVKVSTPRRVRREVENYRRFVDGRRLGQFHTQLEASRAFWDVGASVYTFLGDDGATGLRTLRKFYAAEQDVQRLLTPIRFWQGVWANAYPVKRHSSQQATLDLQYDRLLGLQKNLSRINQQARPAVLAAADLLDPLQWLRERGGAFVVQPGVWQVIHGDFHADNVFTDGERAWVVDFERTGHGPLYADYCELELDVLTRLLPAMVGAEEFLRLVTMLADIDGDSSLDTFSTEACKAACFVRGLRDIAFAMTKTRHPIAYQWGLLCDALFVAGMRLSFHNTQEQSVQQERAWLYASALCTCIEANQRPEATHL